MSKPMNATHPSTSATVSASAGTGKTWLLVTRLVRLLLVGTRPEGILAVTFTRKAAAEMQTRLNDRLLELAQCPPQQLDTLLSQIGAPIDDVTRHRARTLYETLLSAPTGIRTSTFHSFCQDILCRFPLEAGIAPGFELLGATAELQQIAWDGLCAEASDNSDGDTARALESLFEHCGGLANTREALDDFLTHRSDWWAFTEQQNEPLAFALQQLTTQLKITPDERPEQTFFDDTTLALLNEFADLLRRHPGKQNNAAVAVLTQAPNRTPAERFTAVMAVFLTQQGNPRARKESKTQAKAMGETGQARFLEIHLQLCASIDKTRARLRAQQTFTRTAAWYQAGTRLLDYFQHLKAEQRVLDFADLEWQACQLLNHGENVHWIQYKLDQRIDHLLIDEFQDTNPTQWRLILPLLQELAAGGDQRGRSVFLVGDDKQSIYRFRRADPELFGIARHWLQKHLNAIDQPLDVSWRSAEAIMQFVNCVFGKDPLHQHLTHFTPHSTHHPTLWGQVEFLPLIQPDETTDTIPLPELRNPLQAPRTQQTDQRHLKEGRLIATRIRELVDAGTLIGSTDTAHPMHYSDVIILLRQRTHAAAYELALREADIPYAGADRGTLLESLEAQDLLSLLELLITPYNNLALAGLLRSPLFACGHSDLIALAGAGQGSWLERLAILAPVNKALQHAYRLLSDWRARVGYMPVHDLLDRIFCEGDVLNRYHTASPTHLRHQVEANLTRFLELALEIDSGRYPSLGHFIARLHALRQQTSEAPDAGASQQGEARVRLMTIHAAKGLEAPVVFLADAGNVASNNRAYHAIVDWPTQSPRPTCMLLAGRKEELDEASHKICECHARAEAREDANLLYVAVTRTQQLLLISGCRPRRGDELSWYGLLTAPFKTFDAGPVLKSGNPPRHAAVTTPTAHFVENIDPRLQQPLPDAILPTVIFPSHSVVTNQTSIPVNNIDGRLRGVAIHRMLQLLCEGETHADTNGRISAELGIATTDTDLQHWQNEAEAAYRNPALAWIFTPSAGSRAYDEVSIQYEQDGQIVAGVIDRLIVSADTIWIIDYKTHKIDDTDAVVRLVAHFREQLHFYAQGVRQLWPDRPVRSGLLLTHSSRLVEIN
jgi:ATP-dependent helicase/nuclease subunit A